MSKAQTVRQRVEQIAHDFDVEGFGGAMPKKSKATSKTPRKKTAYQEFVAKHRQGNKYSMADISKMWREKQGKSDNKAVSPAKKSPVKRKRSVSNLDDVKKIMAQAKENGIKFSKDEKAQVLKNHNVSHADYKASKPAPNKDQLKKKLLAKKKN